MAVQSGSNPTVSMEERPNLSNGEKLARPDADGRPELAQLRGGGARADSVRPDRA
jgi:hypothetical protein